MTTNQEQRARLQAAADKKIGFRRWTDDDRVFVRRGDLRWLLDRCPDCDPDAFATPAPAGEGEVSLWRKRHPDDPDNGWTYKFSEVENVAKEASERAGYDYTLEVIEAVMQIADERLAALTTPDSVKGAA